MLVDCKVPTGGKVLVKKGSDILSKWIGGTEENIRAELACIVRDEAYRQRMLAGYDEVIERLGEPGASQRAAQGMIAALRDR